MATDNLDLGKALAPADTIFEVTEGVNDPLAQPDPAATDLSAPPAEDVVEILDQAIPPAKEPTSSAGVTDSIEIEEDIPTSALDDLTKTSIDLTGDSLSPSDKSLDEQLDELEDELAEDEVEIEEPSDSVIDLTDPNMLVASILDKARAFTKYAKSSPNSVRRAAALCDHLEKMIVAGVSADAVNQKLSLAQLRLLDDIEAGILSTKAFLARENGDRKITAKARFVENNLQYDPFCSTVARILVNAQVQGGKKVQDIFSSLKDKYAIDKREALMISQIMQDMGYPVRSLLDGEDMIEQHYA